MSPRDRVDAVIRNARVFTADDSMPWAQAVAIRRDRIATVGSDDEVREFADPATDDFDAGGRLLLPGFVDSHNHVRLGSVGDAVQFAGATRLEEIHARIAEFISEHPDTDWVEGEGWNYTAIPGGRTPTAADLEGTTGGRPAFLYSYDVHTVWLNREALERFDITRDMPVVPFGHVEMDAATGEPTGFVTDFAVMGLSRSGQARLEEILPSYSKDRQYRRLVDGLEMAARFGITTIVEPQNSVDDLALFERARREGVLRSRLVAALFHPVGTTAADLDEFDEVRRRFDDDRLRVAPIKLYIDDVVEPHTAAMLEDYANRTGERGETFWEPGEFAELLAKLERRGFQTFTHATGDRGIRTALDAVAHSRRVNGPLDARHQIVHVECLAAPDIPRFAELGVVACMQPRHCAPDIVGGDWAANVGPERWRHAWAFRSLHEAGATLAFSSDWNVAEMDPLVGIYTAQTRADLEGRERWVPEEAVDLTTAIRAYTMGGAYANFAEADRGSITPGKYADLVVLSDDLFDLQPEAALGARVELTMVGGEIVHGGV